MVSNSTRASHDPASPCQKSPGREQTSRRQTTGHTLAVSKADPETDLNKSLPEHDRDSDTTNSTVITSEDLDRQLREYEELVAETYRHVVGKRPAENSARLPQEMNQPSKKRGLRAVQSAQRSTGGRKKRKVLADEPHHASSGEPEHSSTFLAVVKTCGKTTGIGHDGEILLQVGRLTDVKRDTEGQMTVKAHLAPIWVPIQDLRGQKSHEAAKRLVVRKFGEDAWADLNEGMGTMESYVKERIAAAE